MAGPSISGHVDGEPWARTWAGALGSAIWAVLRALGGTESQVAHPQLLWLAGTSPEQRSQVWARRNY